MTSTASDDQFLPHQDDVAQAQPKRRPYNASASLSEYGIFPECDAAQAPAKGADVALPPLPRLIPVEHFEKQQAMWEYARAAVLADRQQRKPWPMEEQPDGTVTPVDPIDRQQRGGDCVIVECWKVLHEAGLDRRHFDGPLPDAIRAALAAQPAASAEPSDDVVELISLLRAIRPKYGYVGTRDVDVAAQQHRIDRAIALLSLYGRPAGDAQPVAWLRNERGEHSGPATLDPLVLLAEPTKGAYRATYTPLYAAPVAAQKADDARDAERYRWLRKGANDEVAVVRGLGAMDYGMSAVVPTYSEELYGDDLDAAIDDAIAQQRKGEGGGHD